jgi:hypothetical protein
MPKDTAVTIRLPASLKRALQICARRERRSLSSEIVARLEREVADAEMPEHGGGRLLGLYKGAAVPSEEDFATVRRVSWARLRRSRARRAS